MRSIPIELLLYANHSKEEIFFEIVLEDKDGETVARNYFYPVPMKNISGIKDPELTVSHPSFLSLVLKNIFIANIFEQVQVAGQDCSNATPPYTNSFSLLITVRFPALLVYLELTHPDYIMKRHTFSTNGFTQTAPRKTIYLVFENDSECIRLNSDNIKVQTINQYL